MSDPITGPVEAALERGLDVAALRHRLTASNVANLDTPGYEPRHVTFAEALVAVEGQAPELELKRTDRRHLAPAATGVRVEVGEDGAARRPDGNGVDPEREMRDLQANAIAYAALAQALAGRYRTLRTAINEGRQG
jgi:flagellar basal-body rod protein FlgB